MESAKYHKRCSCCGGIKSLSEFYKLNKKYSKDGYTYRCKECDKKESKKTYNRTIELSRIKRKKWQEEHHDEHLIHQREYYKRKKAKEEKTKTKSGSSNSSKNGKLKTTRESAYERWKQTYDPTFNREDPKEFNDN